MISFSISLILIFSSFNVFARNVDTLASCKLQNGPGDESLSSYSVLRDGDRLFGRYRLNEGRDFEETDDIFVKKFEEEDLEKLKEDGRLDKLAESLNIDIKRIDKVSFFGILEVEDEDEDEDEENSFLSQEDEEPPLPSPPIYLMEIYRVSGAYGVLLGQVGKPLDKGFIKCSNSRFFYSL